MLLKLQEESSQSRPVRWPSPHCAEFQSETHGEGEPQTRSIKEQTARQAKASTNIQSFEPKDQKIKAVDEDVGALLLDDIEKAETFCNRYYRYVRRIGFRLLNDDDEADDLAQEVMIKAVRGWRNFRGDSSERTWITRIAINHGIDQREKRERRKEINSTDRSQYDDDGQDRQPLPEAHDLSPPTSQMVMGKMLREVVQQHINSLASEKHRVTLNLLIRNPGLTDETLAKELHRRAVTSRIYTRKGAAKIRHRAQELLSESLAKAGYLPENFTDE